MDRTEPRVETQWDKKAAQFRLCKWIVLALLVLFLITGLILFENDITVENLRYLVKYLDFSGYGSYSEETVIHYNADSANRFHVFRGDLAQVNEKSLTLYDRRGTPVLNDSYHMTTPIAVCGEKYLVVYDLGGYQMRIYNSFSLLQEKTFPYLLQSVTMDSEGNLCVVTSEKSYHSAVYVYDEDLQEIHAWRSTDRFAVDASLSDYGILTVSTIRVSGGELYTDLVEMEVGNTEILSVFTISDQMPVSHSTDETGTLLVTEDHLIRLQNGQELRRANFPSDSLEQIRFGEDRFVSLQNELLVGVNYRLRIFDREGNELTSYKFSVSVRDIEIWENTVYVLTHNGLVVFDTEEEIKVREYALSGDFSDLGILSRDVVILCSDTAANVRILT